MTARDEYEALCREAGDAVPLFLQHWWWEAVCGTKRWDVLLHRSGGRIVGAMPYMDSRRLGLRYSLMPQMTMHTGPWLADESDTDTLRLLYAQLLQRRPLLYVGRLSPSLTAAVPTVLPTMNPFVWFKASEHYTYRFDPIRPLPELMAAAEPLRRRDYKRLRAELDLDLGVSPSDFALFHAAHIARQGKREELPAGLVVRVCTAAVARQQGLIVGARGHDGTLHAAVFVAYDSRCAYLLMLARSADAPRNAMAFLIWQTVGLMASRSRVFDFEGGMEPGVGRYYRSFGAQRTAMLQLSLNRLPFVRI